ncbi:hypothetical protein G4Z16_00965 [Streptomyces bathyalis]|uniref:Uncharacterized protein n=1 Tax=Streptomyces bathyalis TaxID=2710756 RepID=A0A7T1T2I2_9ACTN|nr:hypothetical protein [Streptomyces bathyalis]QPP05192.1 hypothetical protein G4Z16_00965 [Streptomyces bathyalis]
MAYIDHHDVFFGSAEDGSPFVVVNADLPAAHRILTQSGFTAHEQHGHIWYRLPPGTSHQDADQATALAFMQLLATTTNIADLTSTADEEAVADVHFDLTGPHVTATTHWAAIRHVLALHGFRPTPAGHVLPPETTEAEAIAAVVRAEAHLYTTGARIHINLGIPAPENTPRAHSRPPRTISSPAQVQVQRHR